MQRRNLFVSVILFTLATGCNGRSDSYQGYVEADYVYLSSPLGGLLEERPVVRGADVKSGDILFSLERDRELAARSEKMEQLASARAQFENLQKGKRPSEIASLEAQIADAEAALSFARKERDRVDKLSKTDVLPKRDYDEAHSRYDRATATLRQLKAELTTAKLGAREDEILAAAAEVKSREQELAQASWNVTQKSKTAPFDSSVFDTYYEQGEWVAAGSPVVSLLSTERLKIKFFIPEPELSLVHVGDTVEISGDNFQSPLRARISFISPEAEYTPPVIFSRETRSKLVFAAEARLEAQSQQRSSIKPGQPVNVTPEA